MLGRLGQALWVLRRAAQDHTGGVGQRHGMGSCIRSPTAGLLRAQAPPSSGQGVCAAVRSAARGCAFTLIGGGSKRSLCEQKLAVHEAVCAECWKQAIDRRSRLEMVLGAVVLLLLVREGSVVQVMRRLMGG